MTYGQKTIEWRIARFFVKWWVKRLIRRHIKWLGDTKYKRSNMNYAKSRYMQAKIAYWRESFQPWGDWNYFGCRCFSFNGNYEVVINAEMDRMGFNQKLEWEKCGD
jgi:hypothetical protein